VGAKERERPYHFKWVSPKFGLMGKKNSPEKIKKAVERRKNDGIILGEADGSEPSMREKVGPFYMQAESKLGNNDCRHHNRKGKRQSVRLGGKTTSTLTQNAGNLVMGGGNGEKRREKNPIEVRGKSRDLPFFSRNRGKGESTKTPPHPNGQDQKGENRRPASCARRGEKKKKGRQQGGRV